jgi:hypothetical protein
MIRYSLKCSAGHAFESWFGSSEAFDRLMAAQHVTCPECGATEVCKALMAPGVRPARSAASLSDQAANPPQAPADTAAADQPARPLSVQDSPRQAALAELRRMIESKSEYVGLQFAAEARRIHEGDAPERPIYGEAKIEEAKALIEDGVPVAPLPFLPARRAN